MSSSICCDRGDVDGDGDGEGDGEMVMVMVIVMVMVKVIVMVMVMVKVNGLGRFVSKQSVFSHEQVFFIQPTFFV